MSECRPVLAAQAARFERLAGRGVAIPYRHVKLADIPRIVAIAPSALGGAQPPTEVEALSALPWVALNTYYRDEVELQCVRSGAQRVIPVRPQMLTDSLYALRNAALLGLGACIASAWVIREDIARGDLVHLMPDWQAAPLPIYLVYPSARFYPVRLRRFLDAMREAVAEAVAERGLIKP